MDADVTVEILREIRDEIRSTRTELKSELVQVNNRLDVVTERLDVVTERLDVVTERLGTVEHTLTDFAGQHLLLTRYVKNVSYRHDDELADLRGRVEKLERK